MKVLHLSAASESTGAGKATLLTHYALKKIGIESKILFLKSNLVEEDIYSFHKQSILCQYKRKINTLLERTPLFFYPKRKNQIFSPALNGLHLINNKHIRWADIIHIHWANHGFIDIKEINKWNKPVIWTLRDMWAFTGGCHQSFECENFKNICGKCPLLGSDIQKDLAYLTFNRKIQFLKNSNIKWVAISSWMKKKALESKILENKNIEIIYSGVDSNQFVILNKNQIREQLGFCQDDKIILIGAGNIRESFKGFEFAVEAMNRLNRSYKIITFGSQTFLPNEIPQKYIHYGVVNINKLVKLYNAADLFLGPSIAEAMGKTFVEAQLCGLPAICFKNTGPEDIIQHKKTGYIAKFKDVDDLIKGVDYCFNTHWNHEYIRKHTMENFDISIIAKKYINIYEKSIKSFDFVQ